MRQPPIHHRHPDELAIVRAACAPPAQAAAAWREWRSRHGIDDAPVMQKRLLPWIYGRRDEIGIDPDDLPLLQSLERHCWMRNQVLLSEAAALSALLREAGIEALFIKGLPLMRGVYPSEGFCFMSDLDFMVRRPQVERASAVLRAAGHTPAHGPWLLAPVRTLGAWHHQHSLVSPGGIICDPHWNLLIHPTPAVDETPFWNRRRTLRIRGETVAVPPPEEMLMMTLCRGFSWERDLRSLRWMVDACLLIRSGLMDWERFAAEGRARRITHHLRQAAAHLEEIIPGTIPDRLIEACAGSTPGFSERVAYRYHSRDFRGAGLAERAAYLSLRGSHRLKGLRQRISKLTWCLRHGHR